MLTGGADADVFVFSAAGGAGNVDQITDFNVADDTIWLDNAIFTLIGADGALSASQFVIGAAAATINQHVVYDDNTGFLYYDANGSTAGGVTQIATLTAHLALTNADFLVI